MKFKYWLIALLAFVAWVPNAFAVAYYYRVDNGNYLLCDGTKCDEVEPGQQGVTFNLAAGQITYNGIVFQYDSVQQENYNNSMIGQTRMFYYVDDNGRYVFKLVVVGVILLMGYLVRVQLLRLEVQLPW